MIKNTMTEPVSCDILLERIDSLLTQCNSEWDKQGYEGEMRCEIQWNDGRWTLEIGDGSTHGKSDEFGSLDSEQLTQAIARWVPALKDWIDGRPQYGHSVEIEQSVLKIIEAFLVDFPSTTQ
jgi:hypothetical protein